MEQLLIGLTGGTAIFLTQCKSERLRRLAPLFGVCSQPFWFYTTFINHQWGIFALSFFYTLSWVKGVKMNMPFYIDEINKLKEGKRYEQ